jgi:hypothetical protein
MREVLGQLVIIASVVCTAALVACVVDALDTVPAFRICVASFAIACCAATCARVLEQRDQ